MPTTALQSAYCTTQVVGKVDKTYIVVDTVCGLAIAQSPIWQKVQIRKIKSACLS